jgi:hypothetical protein
MLFHVDLLVPKQREAPKYRKLGGIAWQQTPNFFSNLAGPAGALGFTGELAADLFEA